MLCNIYVQYSADSAVIDKQKIWVGFNKSNEFNKWHNVTYPSRPNDLAQMSKHSNIKLQQYFIPKLFLNLNMNNSRFHYGVSQQMASVAALSLLRWTLLLLHLSRC